MSDNTNDDRAARTKAAADAKAKADADAQAKTEAETKAQRDAREKATAADAEARAAATRGAQVVLDPASAAALAAKGGAGATIAENTHVRDAALIDMGLDPAAPSAHTTDPQPAPDKPAG